MLCALVSREHFVKTNNNNLNSLIFLVPVDLTSCLAGLLARVQSLVLSTYLLGELIHRIVERQSDAADHLCQWQSVLRAKDVCPFLTSLLEQCLQVL